MKKSTQYLEAYHSYQRKIQPTKFGFPTCKGNCRPSKIRLLFNLMYYFGFMLFRQFVVLYKYFIIPFMQNFTILATPMPWPGPNHCEDVDHDQNVVPDPEDCHCFYNCTQNAIQGHECCISGLAFDSNLLLCNWVFNVPNCRWFYVFWRCFSNIEMKHIETDINWIKHNNSKFLSVFFITKFVKKRYSSHFNLSSLITKARAKTI